MLDHAEDIRHLEVMKHPPRKDGSEETKNDPVLEVRVTCHLYQYGIEVKPDSMKYDGSQSWNVISTGMNQDINELPKRMGHLLTTKR